MPDTPAHPTTPPDEFGLALDAAVVSARTATLASTAATPLLRGDDDAVGALAVYVSERAAHFADEYVRLLRAWDAGLLADDAPVVPA